MFLVVFFSYLFQIVGLLHQSYYLLNYSYSHLSPLCSVALTPRYVRTTERVHLNNTVKLVMGEEVIEVNGYIIRWEGHNLTLFDINLHCLTLFDII